jgi:hypothetical protein
MVKSTGPRTPRGKARSSLNAAKHWIECRRILPDEREQAAILRRGFEIDFKPEGLIEHEIRLPARLAIYTPHRSLRLAATQGTPTCLKHCEIFKQWALLQYCPLGQ